MKGKPFKQAKKIFLIFIIQCVAISASFGQKTNPRFKNRHANFSPLPEVLTTKRLKDSVLHESLRGVRGERLVMVRLRTNDTVNVKAKKKVRESGTHGQRIQAFQRSFISSISNQVPDLKVVARTQLVLNALYVSATEEQLQILVQHPDVLRISPVGNYELHLAETVPYIGGTDVQAEGFDGSGIEVAVLDTGVDYTHANLGGPGTEAAYLDAIADLADPGALFPTAKVVGGKDFVGSGSTSADVNIDDDPIDEHGHGTHVADIIAGGGGVAPGADIYALRVCGTAGCPGLSIIQAIEFAVDPDGDGDPSDHVDIINMSLGANYGQPFDDDLSAAVDAASAMGVLTVASAGNGSDKPYILGTPSAARTALSVAQTQVPSAGLNLMDVIEPVGSAGSYIAIAFPWSVELIQVIAGPVQYGDGSGGALNGCNDGGGNNPFATGSLTGKIVMVDRGACRFDEKIKNIDDAGGILGIVGRVNAGDPFPGGGDPIVNIPGFMISSTTANILRTGAAQVSFDPSNVRSLAMSMVSSSSRGPDSHANSIKPEIGAPGASVSALVGSGDGTSTFGGTSGAAPMVSGAAALLMEAEPDLSWSEVKRRLILSAETNILNTVPGDLAPITRIGGGEVRVDKAVDSPVDIVEQESNNSVLSFGFMDISRKHSTVKKRLKITNRSDESVSYNLQASYRFADDEANGAVTFQLPPKVNIGAGQTKNITIKAKFNGELLRPNLMNSGSNGSNPNTLTTNEYDGYIVFESEDNTVQIPWHVLPRQAAQVDPEEDELEFVNGEGSIKLENKGVGVAQNAAYALLALSDNLPEGGRGEQNPTPDIRAVGVNTYLVPSWYCSAGFVWSFAINSWERQSYLMPVSYLVYLDINQDGVDDYVVLNRDFSVFTSGSLGSVDDGRQLAAVFNLSTGNLGAYFYAEHATNSANTVLNVCGEQLGLSSADILATQVNMSVVALDFYFGGDGDEVTGITIAPLGEQYFALVDDIAGKGTADMAIYDFGILPGNSPELGLMLMTDSARSGSYGGATMETETIIFDLDDDDDD